MAVDSPRRRLIIPEVVQTSAMDCGPASLKCLLDGFGIPASYGRLREACQTDVDGTSIDTLEEVAMQLGLAAEQIMVPADHVLLDEAQALPAIVVVRLPNGLTHFVVAWRRQGGLVQVMDPASGRRWPTRRRFLDELYIHAMPVPAADWRMWAGSAEFLAPLGRRLTHLGLDRRAADQIIRRALEDAGWRSIAALDASARMVAAVARAGGLRPGRQAARVLEALFEYTRGAEDAAPGMLPAVYWSVQPAPPDEEGGEQVLLRGALLVRMQGRRAAEQPDEAEEAGEPAPLSPELAAALVEPPARPWLALWRLLRADSPLLLATIAGAMVIAAAGLVLEGLLLNGLLSLGERLGAAGQRLGAIAALLIFVTALLLIDLPITAGILRLQRHLETRLRIEFLRKIPRLGDRYFHSRPISDMAERSHTIHRLRPFIDGLRQISLILCELLLTVAALAWLYPAGAPIALAAAAFILALAVITQPLLSERDLRVRTHSGALGRFYLDALLGLVAIRTHRAERAIRREHESLLVEWARARLGLQRASVLAEGLMAGGGFGGAVWLLFDHVGRGGAIGGTLLLVYWALKLPTLGQQLAQLAQNLPSFRNTMLRLLEPLGAPEEAEDGAGAADHEAACGATIAIEGVTVRAAGHTILEDIDLAIPAGSHVAIVGPSGAGKSSLVGLLLGWHHPAAGQVCIDGAPLDGPRLAGLRRSIAWVDPAVQLWNRSLFDNLRYGSPDDTTTPIGWVVEQAELRQMLERLPAGLQTPLGEGGALLSGGEGQRVRLGRALLRPGVRLAILDEPFRGLSREQRSELLTRARRLWKDATLLCITHDIGETRAFERVLVVEGGRIVEDGAPATLAAQPDSRYRALLDAEEAVRTGLWSDPTWRRLRMDGGRLIE